MTTPIYQHKSERESDDGFLYVASRDRKYYEYAINSCESLKAYYPNSHVTLFTHKNFVDDRANIFDNIITNIPIHLRAKMWCMARTPYKRTVYIDADSLVNHRDVKKLHDFLDDCDMFFTPVLDYAAGDFKWTAMDIARTEFPQYHGSMCGYHNTSLNLDFMQTWFDDYVKQRSEPWPYEAQGLHYQEWQQFDMFTLWRMTCNKFDQYNRFHNLNIKIIPARYNAMAQYHVEDKGLKPVVYHMDNHTQSGMPHLWAKVKKGASDEAYTVKKQALTDPLIKYN